MCRLNFRLNATIRTTAVKGLSGRANIHLNLAYPLTTNLVINK